jgi:hypothetical protein
MGERRMAVAGKIPGSSEHLDSTFDGYLSDKTPRKGRSCPLPFRRSLDG